MRSRARPVRCFLQLCGALAMLSAASAGFAQQLPATAAPASAPVDADPPGVPVDTSAPGVPLHANSPSAPTDIAAAPNGAADEDPPPALLRCPAPASVTRSGDRGTLPSLERSNVDATTPVEVSSDEATLGVDGDARLRGNVRVRQGDRQIRADDVEYDAQQNGFVVKGSVEYRDPLLRVKGGSGAYSPAEGAAFEGAEFELPARPARGAARSLAVGTDGIVRLDEVLFSTCPAQDASWQIRARRIALDTRERQGTGQNAAVEFKGVPLLYLPYISFPIGNQRKSGFLFPSVGYSSRSGAQAAVPYYWNIAPQQDVTLQPTLHSRRGLDLGAEYRYLTPGQRGIFALNYLPSDRVENFDRHRLQWQHSSQLPGDWLLALDAEDVSDAEYFEDFAEGTAGTSIPFLSRRLRLDYRNAWWTVLGEVQEFQTIDRGLAAFDRPYATVPRLLVRGARALGASERLRTRLDSELVNFQRSTGATGWRLDAEPTIAFDAGSPGIFMRPSAGLRYTQYRLDEPATPGAETTITRTVPYAAFDAGLQLERPGGLRDEHRITLEPRVLYLYAPFRDQSSLPVFDTVVPDLDFVQLFRTNRYVGGDRVSDANQLSFGLQGALFESASGARRIAATVGQIWYFDEPRVLLPGEPRRRRGASDLIAQVAWSARRDWNADLGLQWNPDTTREERAQARLQYRPAPDRVVNLLYRTQRDRLRQAEVSTAWPVRREWNLFARWVYDFQEQRSLERFAGLEYKACCWRLRAVARRFVSTRTGEQDTGVYLQLELNGLASVGSSADTFLEQAVQGYSPSAVSP